MRFFLCAILLPILVGCGANAPPDPPADPHINPGHLAAVELAPGIHAHEVGPASAPLRFVLAVPDSLPAHDVPLVLALHWYTPLADDPAGDYLRGFAEPALREMGAIIIAPEAQYARWTGEEVARTLKSLVTSALEAWPVDGDRVVVTGYSMGGIGAWYLVSLYPALFSATIPVAGEPTGVLEPQVPLLVIHGENDQMFDLAVTRQAVAELVRRGGNARLVVAEGLRHQDAGGYVPYLADTVVWLTGEVWATR